MFDDFERDQKLSTAGLPPPDRALQNFSMLQNYSRQGEIPWRHISTGGSGGGKEILCNRDIAVPGFSIDNDKTEQRRYVSARVFENLLKQRFRAELNDAARNQLKTERPDESASGVLNRQQFLIVFALVVLTIAALVKAPITTLIIGNVLVTGYFLAAILFRFVLMLIGALPLKKQPAITIPESELPVITILLPLFQDAESLTQLSAAIDGLHYPTAKKDVKLLLEENDEGTITEAERLGLFERYDVTIVPAGAPQTKPKACNIGLKLARGDLIVIYDAEDQPEPDQLLKAVHGFQDRDDRLICLQARLNYYNRSENWLTSLFTSEYSLWFDWLLPGLQRLNAPIPLGGTSNFFRTQKLIEIGGWDPFNVTEDADLGLRISRLGYRVAMLNSTTFEEANCRVGNWVRQRSRWMKGYMQTWLVHMRHIRALKETTGWRGVFAMQLFVAGAFISALLFPLLWVVFIYWLATHAAIISKVFPEPLLTLNLTALIIGNAVFIASAMIGPLKRGWVKIALAGITAPAYWLLASIAAYRGLFQLITMPYFWEKTDHMISEYAYRRREMVMQEVVVKNSTAFHRGETRK